MFTARGMATSISSRFLTQAGTGGNNKACHRLGAQIMSVLSVAVVAASICDASGSTADDQTATAAFETQVPTWSLWLLALASCITGGVMIIVIASSSVGSPTSPSAMMRGRAAKTGLAVALPYRGTQRCIYMDYNATSPIFPEVSREMFPFLGECFGNPSSAHALGRACKAAVVKARDRVAALLGCSPGEVVFVASGSEADNHAILASLALHAKSAVASSSPSSGSSPSGFVDVSDFSTVPKEAERRPQHVVSSEIEHPAITKCLDHLVAEGKIEVTYVGVDKEGRVSAKDVVEAFRPETALVTIMHSNNEVGSLQPIKEIAEACRARGIMCHTDAAQSIGKVRVKAADLGVDMITIVGHKFGAPKGVAALFVRRELSLPPMIHGGGQEAGRRAGTENVLLISGMGKAAEIVDAELDQLSKHLAAMRERLLELLLAAGLASQGVKVHGPSDPCMRLPNTLSIGFPGVDARILLDRLSETVAASAGSACHAGEATMSGVLRAMGVDETTGFGTLRLSVGRHTTPAEVDRAGAAIAREAKVMLGAAKKER
ncbi:unnamed protein product [Scytosiphon promiscuus]